MGKSLCEHDLLDTAREILKTAAENKCRIVLPVDAVVAQEFRAHAPSHVVGVDHVGDADMILDAGPKSVAEVEKVLGEAKTLVWNGPFGAFELEPFDAATNAVAKFAARLTGEGKLLTVAGGGDTVAALNHAGVADKLHLCLDGRRRLPRMAGRQGSAGRRSHPGVKMLAPRVTLSELGEFIGLCLATASHVVATAGQSRPPMLIEREVGFLSGAKINTRSVTVREAPNPEVAASQSMLIAQSEFSRRLPKARCLAAVLFVAHRDRGSRRVAAGDPRQGGQRETGKGISGCPEFQPVLFRTA